MNPSAPPVKSAPRWRDLTDEQRWERIYKDRERKRALVIDSLPLATALALPCYLMHAAVEELGSRGLAYLRRDAHTAVVGGLALVAKRLVPAERPQLAKVLEALSGEARRTGFYTDAREFLYCAASSTVRLADEYRYPADGPAVIAGLQLKIDAEEGENGDWGLSASHAVRQTEVLYRSLLRTELYPVHLGG